MATEREGGSRKDYFKSRVFKRLFASYLIVIIAWLALYTGWYLYTYRARGDEEIRNRFERMVTSWEMAMDQQIMSARSVCYFVNASESCRTILKTVYIEKEAIDSMQLYRMLGELKRIKAVNGDINIYSLLLAFEDDSRIYLPNTVISANGTVKMPASLPCVETTSVSELLGVADNNVTINRTYLIYADEYDAFEGSTQKGVIAVLLNMTGVDAMARDNTEDILKAEMVVNGRTKYTYTPEETAGKGENIFTVTSAVNRNITYRLTVSDEAMRVKYPFTALVPILLMVLVGLGFSAVTYWMSRRYYRPIGEIGKLVGSGEEAREARSGKEEMDRIESSIRGLIGERDDYRERVSNISGFADQGLVRLILSGQMTEEELQKRLPERPEWLKNPYFILAVINIHGHEKDKYREAQALIARMLETLSTEETTMIPISGGEGNVYALLNTRRTDMEEGLYELHQSIQNALNEMNLQVTMGVSGAKTEWTRIPEALKEAENALEQMLTGGRGSVYFFEETAEDAEHHFWMPGDLAARVGKDLSEGNAADIRELMDEIWRKNFIEDELSTSETRMLTEGLYLIFRRALRESGTQENLVRPAENATADEVFEMYREVLLKAAEKPQAENAENIEDAVCAYIEENIYSKELSLNAVAEKFGISGKAVGAICKKRYGQNYLQYVRERQVKHAIELMGNGMNMEEIASACGFANALTFRRNFKTVTGVNPSEFVQK